MIKSELNQLREENKIFKASSTDFDQVSKNLERKLKEKDWELKDTLSLKEAK
jgi:hypothetical protein